MSILKNTLKLGAAGATIFGIGALFAIQAPEEPIGEVNEAQADIGWFNAGSDGHEFTRAIAAAGFEPRPYDFNGNRMYFAAGSAEGTPDRVEEVMQDIFVETGVNKKDHHKKPTIPELSQIPLQTINNASEDRLWEYSEELKEPFQDMMGGDVMPMQRSKEYVSMIGYDWKLSSQEVADGVADGSLNARNMNPAELASGYKFIDATYEPERGRTSVTSVWTGQDFDGKRMSNEQPEMRRPDKTVPSCPGCGASNYRMESLASNEPYVANQWTSNEDPATVSNFYRAAMTNRGWTETGIQPKIDKIAQKLPSVAAIEGRMLQFEKDGQMLHVAFVPNGQGGTEIMTTERHAGAKSLLKSVDDFERERIKLD